MESTGLMERLKESTRAMHDSAESSKFQGCLANGVLPQRLYADYLEQLYLIHSHLEREIAKHAELGAGFAAVVAAEQLQEGFLRKDLECFGRAVDGIIPLRSSSKLLQDMDELSRECPVALLGMHYVLLGSKHGGKFIAKSCQEKYKLQEGSGVLYFDPYGANFMPVWKAFKESMTLLNLGEEEAARLCDAASKMFSAVALIGDELMERVA